MVTPKVRPRNSEAQPPAPPAQEDPERRPPKSPPFEEEEMQSSTPPSSPAHHHWRNHGKNACVRINQYKRKNHEGKRTIVQQENLRAKRAQVEDRRSPSDSLLLFLLFLLLLLFLFLLPLRWRVRGYSPHRNGRKGRRRTSMI